MIIKVCMNGAVLCEAEEGYDYKDSDFSTPDNAERYLGETVRALSTFLLDKLKKAGMSFEGQPMLLSSVIPVEGKFIMGVQFLEPLSEKLNHIQSEDVYYVRKMADVFLEIEDNGQRFENLEDFMKMAGEMKKAIEEEERFHQTAREETCEEEEKEETVLSYSKTCGLKEAVTIYHLANQAGLTPSMSSDQKGHYRVDFDGSSNYRSLFEGEFICKVRMAPDERFIPFTKLQADELVNIYLAK